MHLLEPVGVTPTAFRQHDKLERPVHRLLHGGGSENGRSLIEEVVIDVDESITAERYEGGAR